MSLSKLDLRSLCTYSEHDNHFAMLSGLTCTYELKDVILINLSYSNVRGVYWSTYAVLHTLDFHIAEDSTSDSRYSQNL